MRTEDLQALGLTEEQIKEVFALNGKDVQNEKKKTEKAEGERDQWKTRAETAEDTLKGFDGVDVEKLTKDIADWKSKAEQAEKDYRDQLRARDFNDTLEKAMNGISFTSEAAKRAVTEEIRSKGLTFENGQIYGLNDVINEIKARDASAFSSGSQIQFTDRKGEPGRQAGGFDKMSLMEKMHFANEHPTNAEVVNWLSK